MIITPVLILTLLCAIALGWVGHALFGRQKKRSMPPSGSALQRYDPVWADASHVKEMRK